MIKKYDEKDIRVIAEIEHIRMSPGMYIGDTTNPVHLIEEALDNALDEALAGHAKVIAVSVDTKSNTYAVLDNGRGIPISDNVPTTISSKLFSGAKFQDKKTAYEISSGLHGVGLVAVNALSDHYQIEIYRDKKHATFEFENAKLKKKLIVDHDGQVPFSTKIQFKPSKKYFETTKADLDRIRKRLMTAAAEMSGIKLVLMIDDNNEVFYTDLVDYFKEFCLTDKDSDILQIESNKEPEKFRAMMAYEEKGSNAPKIISSINLLPVEGGGTHVNMYQDILKDFFQTKAKKHGFVFQPRDCLYGLRAYLMLNLKEPKFAGQTKDKLTNRKTELEKFVKDLQVSLEGYANDNEEQIIKLLTRFQTYRKKLDSKSLVTNGTGKRASTKFTKLRDCTSRHNSELYIVEGESAGGSIIQSRDPSIHAVLPLKGKSIPNITTKKDILKNKEVGELITAIGTGVGPHFDLSKMRYDKIICATDADSDGAHIACLLTMVLGILTPEIIKAGRYYIAQTPLFAINIKNTFIPLWTQEEFDKARKDDKSISRFKGLGELTPAQLKKCLLDPNGRNLMLVEYTTDLDKLVGIFSSADEKRKLLDEEKE